MNWHVHVHLLVPGGGPSLDGSRWIDSKHPTDRHYKKPYLTDVEQLSEAFRKKFTAGLRRLHRQDKIDYTPPLLVEQDPHPIRHQETFAEWTDRVGSGNWCVFIQPPPANSTPEHALKYLARYLSGGPIADGRLISHEDGKVKFWARGQDKKSRPFKLPGSQFVQRWSLHILPKGYTRSRYYGGFSYTQRRQYLKLCRQLLSAPVPVQESPVVNADSESGSSDVRRCPCCQTPMRRIEAGPRPSWKDVIIDFARVPWYVIMIRGPD